MQKSFLNYYESNGWKVGKNPMKDWKAAVRTWEKSGFNTQKRSIGFQEDNENTFFKIKKRSMQMNYRKTERFIEADINADFEPKIQKVKDWLLKYKEFKNNLIISGMSGTGKTWVIMAFS